MKAKLIALFMVATAMMAACKKEPVILPDALSLAKTNLESVFETVDENMAAAINYSLATNLDTTLIRAKLAELVAVSSYIAEFAWVTPDGILKIIEPATFYYSQGADISRQDHIVKCFDTKEPVLGKVISVVEGYEAAVLIHPCVKNKTIMGGIAAVIRSEDLLSSVLYPLVRGEDFELWAMEKGGRIIYDQDVEEEGLNLFTDPLYQDFPELLAAGKKIDKEESGSTTYSFYQTGTSSTVTKLTYWTTVAIHGMEWKLVWVKKQ